VATNVQKLPSPALDDNARRILEARYLVRDKSGRVVETPEQLFWRVARAVAAIEERFGSSPDDVAPAFYSMIAALDFLPNSPTLMNAGRDMGQLAACFVLPVDDSMDAIFETLKSAALIQQTGGGTGFSFSRLRPKDDIVARTGGKASGPVSFMKVYNAATDAIHQGGVRRGANMAMLRVDHPDVVEFIDAKSDPRELENFNVSVAVTDAFMRAVDQGTTYELVNPRTGLATGSLDARAVWDRIVQRAWQSGEPGLVFIDKVNAVNPTPRLGSMEATNPCVPADTWILTDEGPRRVADLVERPFNVVVDGEVFASERGFVQTGVKPVLEVTTAEGHRFAATEDHRVLAVSGFTRHRRETEWKRVGDLRTGDLLVLNDHRRFDGWSGPGEEHEGYLLGLLVGEGTLTNERGIVEVWGATEGCDELRAAALAAALRLPHRRDFRGFQKGHRGKTSLKMAAIAHLARAYGMEQGRKTPGDAIERAGSAFQRAFLRGLFDTDGSMQGKQDEGLSARLTQADVALLELAQRMLLRLGIASTIYRDRKAAGMKRLPDGRGGHAFYATKALHELVIADENLVRFEALVGFAHGDKKRRLRAALADHERLPNRERFVAQVTAVAPRGVEPVYDVTVPGRSAFDGNGFVLHNCAELPLLPYESCNLGSVNVARFVTHQAIDWDRLRGTIKLAVRFLDDVVEANRYPLPAIEAITKANRKIGLGVMGFADLLVLLGIRYDSERALALAEEVAGFIHSEAKKASEELAEKRGPFPGFLGSLWDQRGDKPRRNATVSTVAPTGTISLIAGCSSGIEPLFAVSYVRRALDGQALLTVVHPELERVARARGFHTETLASDVAKTGTLGAIPGVPEDVKDVFRTAHEIAPEWHVRMQAAFQKHVENAVSKTINLPREAAPEDVKRAYRLAYDLGCKGITVYRDGSRESQVLSVPSSAPVEQGRKPRPRPEVTRGMTVKKKTADGNLYVTINEDEDGQPFELFATLGKAGGCEAAMTEAIARLVSLALRAGVDVDEIRKQLRGISCHPTWSEGVKILSGPDAIAQAIELYERGKGREVPEAAGATIRRAACPECGSRELSHEEGCVLCRDCGYSECG
jgi:ribonucleoside-diphosphate reductase alpha chain